MAHLPSFDEAPRAIILDIDGTLVDSDTRLRSRTAAAVEAALDQGFPVLIATARAIRSTRVLLGPSLTSRLRVVHLDGAVTHDGWEPTRPVASHHLDPAAVRALVALATQLLPGARLVIEREGWNFGSNIDLPPDVLWATNRATPDMVHGVEDALGAVVSKLAISSTIPVDAFVRAARSHFPGQVDVLDEDRFDARYVQVVAPGVSKERSLEGVLQRDGLRLADCLALGDDLADLGFLKAARYGVAMANAHPEVLRQVPYLTASNDEDGVAIVLEQLLRMGRR